MERLKPCPYCGGIPAIAGIITHDNTLAWRLRLGNGQHEDFPTQEAAHEAWNKRTAELSRTEVNMPQAHSGKDNTRTLCLE